MCYRCSIICCVCPCSSAAASLSCLQPVPHNVQFALDAVGRMQGENLRALVAGGTLSVMPTLFMTLFPRKPTLTNSTMLWSGPSPPCISPPSDLREKCRSPVINHMTPDSVLSSRRATPRNARQSFEVVACWLVLLLPFADFCIL